MGKQIFYRGYLTSCNYKCSYCPFSKKSMNHTQFERDKKALFDFVEKINDLKSSYAVQIVPYGEALVHDYYWHALAILSQLKSLDYTGCQTNLSFSVENMLKIFDKYNGNRANLRLWCTFHPSMTTVDDFIIQCNKLEAAGISFCVGMVGNPDKIPVLLKLRQRLPDSVYLWVNKMDGLKRNYTAKEIEMFQNVDPYFFLQLEHRKADLSKCRQSIFYEADGKQYFCNLHASVKHTIQNKGCIKSECNCYLAYCNRTDIKELLFFEPYPAFRIPRYPKAFFMDIDGTILPEGEKELSSLMTNRLKSLSRKSKLFLATQLPYNEAMQKCKNIKDYLSGGIFSGGGYICVKESDGHTFEKIIPLRKIFTMNEQKYLENKYHLKTRIYKKNNIIYRYTFVSMRKKGWKYEEYTGLRNEIEQILQNKNISYMLYSDKKCFGITAKDADKKNGAITICQRTGISLKDGAAVGNSEDDIPMIKLFPVNLKLGDEDVGGKGDLKVLKNSC